MSVLGLYFLWINCDIAVLLLVCVYQLDHTHIDKVIPRKELLRYLLNYLICHKRSAVSNYYKRSQHPASVAANVKAFCGIEVLRTVKVYADMGMDLARSPHRPKRVSKMFSLLNIADKPAVDEHPCA